MTKLLMTAGLFALALAPGSGATALAAPARSLSVGHLAVQLAQSAGIDLPAEDQAPAAAAALRRFGIDLGPSLDRPILERDLVSLGRSLGVRVTTSNPDGVASPAQGAMLASSLRGALPGIDKKDDNPGQGGGQGNGGSNGQANNGSNGQGGGKEGDINASCQGRESRSKRKGTPASPADPNATAPPCTGDEEPQP